MPKIDCLASNTQVPAHVQFKSSHKQKQYHAVLKKTNRTSNWQISPMASNTRRDKI
jgi:hypothetical protein